MTGATFKPNKVLVDLVPALSGFAGIPQESRLLFRTLAELKNDVEAGGLIYSNTLRSLRYDLQAKTAKKEDIITCANFLFDLIEDYSKHPKLGRFAKLRISTWRLKEMFMLAYKRSFILKELNTEHFFDFLWRVFFAKTLLAADYDLLKEQRYLISTLNMISMRVTSMMKSKVKLDTRGWDFAIFQIQRAVKVSAGTTKIIRYHDTIPLHDMDVCIPGSNYGHGIDLLTCVKDSFYVCNSEPTREDLLAIAPELENRSITIPPILASYNKSLHHETLLNIIRRGFSSLMLNEDAKQVVFDDLKKTPNFRYILMLATLEPRKNHTMLIRAWERLRAQHQSNHRLLIVGNAGWKYEDVTSAMKPHLKDGSIIHLEKIMPEDMGYLYSHADAFVFPSFNEGFGSPPLEAMQCECPVIASDIKTHRWVYGDAALYCNPYDTTSLVDALQQLLIAPDAAILKQKLVQKGLEQVKRYHAEPIGQQWLELFTDLKKTPLASR